MFDLKLINKTSYWGELIDYPITQHILFSLSNTLYNMFHLLWR